MSRTLILALSVGLIASVSQAQTPREITFEEIALPRPGEWPSYNGQLSANRHSPLDQKSTPASFDLPDSYRELRKKKVQVLEPWGANPT
jgi:hypothetical protein